MTRAQQAILDLAAGLRQSDVAKKYKVVPSTVSRWAKRARTEGTPLKHGVVGAPPRLSPQQWTACIAQVSAGAQRCGYQDGCWTLARVSATITELQGLSYDITHLRNRLQGAQIETKGAVVRRLNRDQVWPFGAPVRPALDRLRYESERLRAALENRTENRTDQSKSDVVRILQDAFTFAGEYSRPRRSGLLLSLERAYRVIAPLATDGRHLVALERQLASMAAQVSAMVDLEPQRIRWSIGGVEQSKKPKAVKAEFDPAQAFLMSNLMSTMVPAQEDAFRKLLDAWTVSKRTEIP